MKFTKEWENEFTVSELIEDLKKEIMSGDYSDIKNLMEVNKEYFTELTAEEVDTLEDAFSDYEYEKEQAKEAQKVEEERLAKEWEEELAYMNAEYIRSVWVA